MEDLINKLIEATEHPIDLTNEEAFLLNVVNGMDELILIDEED